jgi:hypothetical protein
MEETSQREYNTWQEWTLIKANRPDITQQYLMQIALRIQQQDLKEPNKLPLSSQELKFEKAKPQVEVPMTEEQLAEQALRDKAVVLAALGLDLKGKTIPNRRK